MASFTLQSPTWNGSELNQVNPPYCSWYLWYAQRTEKRDTHWIHQMAGAGIGINGDYHRRTRG